MLQPCGARVLVERIQPDAVSRGGIIIPESAKEKPQIGLVIAVGPGRWLPDSETRRPVAASVNGGLEFGVGDKVVFLRFSGHEIPPPLGERGPDRMLVDEDAVIAVFDRE